MLILHYTGMSSAGEALARLCHPLSEVSAHYLVFEDGRTLQLVPEARRAWHAGAGIWAGEDDLNSCSIGFEIVNSGHGGGLPPYPEEQIAAVIRLAEDVAARWTIPARRVLAHSDVAPARKEDPGERFPWATLARHGIGHWVPPAALGHGRTLSRGMSGPPVGALQQMLARYGYGLEVTGTFDEATATVVRAFQRHFRPERVDGVADASTIRTLRDLSIAPPP